MSVYTVHEPPLRAAEAVPNPERFVFVRDGFYVWAFLLSLLWMLWHRLWLVLLIYVVVIIGIETALRSLGVSSSAIAIFGVLISFLVGIEAATLRRFTLARRGWKNVGVVSGDDLEDAERRFFDGWVRKNGSKPAAPPATPSSPPSPPPAPRSSHGPDVIGLFPEPGASR
jgi:hypothetical protein